MEINIISGKFQFDEDESNDIDFNVSKLIVQMELSEMSKSGLIPDNFNCSFTFSWMEPHPVNNRPIITRVNQKCSEKIRSKELESAVNDRLLKIAKSDEMNFYNEKTDEILLDKIKYLPQTIEFKKESLEQKRKTETFLMDMPEEDMFVESQDLVYKIQSLLMAVSNNRIHYNAAQRVQILLDKV